MGKLFVEHQPDAPVLIYGDKPESNVLERVVQIEVIKEIPVEKIIYQEKEVIKYIEIASPAPEPLIITKEIPVEVIKETIKEVLVEVPIEVIKEKINEVIVEKEKLVTQIQHKMPNWAWLIIGAEALMIGLLLVK